MSQPPDLPGEFASITDGKDGAADLDIQAMGFENVDTLIRILSIPGHSPQAIRSAQSRFQELQRSFEGWEFARRALDHDSETYQFWGASTFVVKIKRDWSSLDTIPNGHEQLLAYLLACFERSVSGAGSGRVSKQLHSALVAYFLQPTLQEHSWFRLVLLGPSYPESLEYQDPQNYIQAFTKSMSANRFRATLAICSLMVEEVVKIEAKQVSKYGLIERLTRDADNIWRLFLSALVIVFPQSKLLDQADYRDFDDLNQSFHTKSEDPDFQAQPVVEEAIYAVQTWVIFSHENVPKEHNEVHTMAQKCIDLVTVCVDIVELSDRAVEALVSVVEAVPSLLHINNNTILLKALTGEQANEMVLSLRDGDFETENVKFATFLVELADTEDFDTPDFLKNPILVQTLRHLQTLLGCSGIPGVEDEVCSLALEIWTKLASGFSDWVGDDETSLQVKQQLVVAVDAGMEKMKQPESPDWNVEDRSIVSQFERDFEEYILAAYPCLGFDLWLKAAEDAFSSLEAGSWPSLAAALFCLCSLAEAVADEAVLDSHIEKIVSNPNWTSICQQDLIPDDKARKWMTAFVASYSKFFQHHRQHLLSVMNFLFNSLRPSNSRSAASRAISTLCQVCRSTLSHNVDDLLQSLENTRWVAIDDEERLFKATAAVIQSLTPESAKYHPLRRLVDLLAKEFEDVLKSSPQDPEMVQTVGVNILRKLASTGKGLRTPEDEPVDLDVEPHDHANPQTPDFWFTGNGRKLKDDICNIVGGLAARFPQDELIIEGIADVLRAGYTEINPSPFGFMPHLSRDFFVAFSKPDTPSVSKVMATASAFLASHAHKPLAIREDFLVMVKAVNDNQASLVMTDGNSRTIDDHEFAYSSLDFLTKMLPKYGSTFYEISDSTFESDIPIISNAITLGDQRFWRITFLFSLLQLGNPDTFPKRSAAQFWAANLEIAGPSSALTPKAASNITELIHFYAPEFTSVLLRQLTGECARSDIDALCDPLRKYIMSHSLLAKRQLESVMAEGTNLHEKVQLGVPVAERTIFVKQIMGLRGARKTNSIVRDFWIRCRGSDFAYTT